MEQTHTPPFVRPRTGRVLTGATTAIANRTGIGRGWIRAGFVLTSLFAGLGINVPFGLSTEYDSDWKGRYHAVESEAWQEQVRP